MTYPTKEKRSL